MVPHPLPIVLLHNTAGRVIAEPAGYLRLHWGSQTRSFADTRAILTRAAGALAAHGWGRILVDQVAMHAFTPQEQQWISQEWLPAAVRESGYRFGAVVVGADVLTRLATAFVISTPEPGLRYRSFGTEEEALAWLLQQPL